LHACRSTLEDPHPDIRRFVVRIPFLTENEHIEVQRVGMDLYMCVGRIARSVSLPRILSNSDMVGYVADGELLTVTFRERAREPEPPRLTRLRRSPASA
jgi:hypothetical protein